MLQLDNIQTSDTYTTAHSLTDPLANVLELVVTVADVYCRFRAYDADKHNQLEWGDEQRIVAPTRLLLSNVAGVEIRSAAAGTPATCTATLYQPADPQPHAASAGATVTTLSNLIGVQHNDSLVGQEGIVDFEDSATIAWTMSDDGPNGRVKISATASVSVPVASVFGRTGAVTAQSGDYTAAQVTNAADKASGSTQTFAAAIAWTSTGTPAITPGSNSLSVGSSAASDFLLLVGSATNSHGEITTSAANGLYIAGSPTTKIGFYGTAPLAQPSNGTQSAGASWASGGGTTPVHTSDSWFGGVGTRYYSIDDLVFNLKKLGLIAS